MPSILSILGPEEGEKKEGSEKSPGDLHQVAEELISAVHEKDVDGVVSALKACYACMESEEPGEE